jgi:hypothetical protein
MCIPSYVGLNSNIAKEIDGLLKSLEEGTKHEHRFFLMHRHSRGSKSQIGASINQFVLDHQVMSRYHGAYIA